MRVSDIGCSKPKKRVSATSGDPCTVPALQASMQAAGKAFESVVYDGAEHAFFNDTRPLYDVRAARDSFARALAFLRVVLG